MHISKIHVDCINKVNVSSKYHIHYLLLSCHLQTSQNPYRSYHKNYQITYQLPYQSFIIVSVRNYSKFIYIILIEKLNSSFLSITISIFCYHNIICKPSKIHIDRINKITFLPFIHINCYFYFSYFSIEEVIKC